MTHSGGPNGTGTVFSMNVDGTSFALIHAFDYAAIGGQPYGSLTLSGSKLYGMTYGSGTSAGGIFSLNTNGSGFNVLRTFNGSDTDGGRPRGSLTLSGSTFYGMTYRGGSTGQGVVFRMNTDGSAFALLHSFTGSPNDGNNPNGSLTPVGSRLYGMTPEGGANSAGTIFSINSDGSGYSVLHNFTAFNVNEGSEPYGSLTLVGSKLYGMTKEGGLAGYGTIFSINLDGSGYMLIHNFTNAGYAYDDAHPLGSLTLVDSTLYGMTSGITAGNVFRINPDGSEYTQIHRFNGWPTDGAQPQYGELIASADGSTLYGMALGAGSAFAGVVFSVSISLVPPTITDFQILAGGPRISFATLAGRNYAVERKQRLSDATWTMVTGASSVSGTGQILQVSDPDPGAGTSPSRFYRVRLLP